MPTLSLVMATLDRQPKTVLRFLDSLARQSVMPLELIIVDQNQDDRLKEVDAAAERLSIGYARIKEARRNLSHARNVGIRQAQGDIVGFPDDDCWYEPDVVENVQLTFRRDRSISALTGLWLEAPFQPAVPGNVSAEDIRQYRAVRLNSNGLFINRKALLEVGGFDDRLGTGQWFGSGEETDVIIRITAKGYRLRYEPAVRVHHPYKQNLEEDMAVACRRLRLRARGSGAIYVKNRLGLLVVVRGLLSPLARIPACAVRDSCRVRRQLCIALGRWEGFFGWRRRYGAGS